MSSYDDTASDTRAKQLIQDRQERLEEVLDIFSQQAAEVSLTPQMKREIAVHIVNYHRVLSNYEDETVLDDGDIPDIDPIRDRLGHTTRVATDSAGIGRGGSYERVPAVEELDFWYLESVAGDLEAAAKKLGFWATADAETTHRTEIDSDLIEQVEEWRQNNLEA
jgi:hypothetical protein